MAVVIVVMYIAARVLKTRGFPGLGRIGAVPPGTIATTPEVLQILGRQGVGKGASVAIVQAGAKKLVLGVTDSQISLLAELEDEMSKPSRASTRRPELDEMNGSTQRTGTPESLALAGLDPAWKAVLEQVRERTVRRV